MPPFPLRRGILEEIERERNDQVSVNDWSYEHDDQLTEGQLALAAAGYCQASTNPTLFYRKDGLLPIHWPTGWIFNPTTPRRDLIKAAALVVAEIERLDRDHIREIEYLESRGDR